MPCRSGMKEVWACSPVSPGQNLASHHHPVVSIASAWQVRCGPARLDFHGSLLQLRGAAPSTSPLRDAAGNVLLFNGQIFGGSLEVQPGASDAQLLLQALGQPGADVPAVLSGLRGPWVLAFWQAAARTLWYGRDSIGELLCLGLRVTTAWKRRREG